jgi:hypothetical protein
MAVPSRRDRMYSNIIKQQESKSKEVKEEEKKKDPKNVKSLIEMWNKKKEKKSK